MEHRTVYIPSTLHGQLVGPRGATIQRLQTQGQIRIRVPPNDSKSHAVIFSGSPERVRDAIDAVARELRFTPSSEPLHDARFVVPKTAIGLILGRQGETCKALQDKYHAHMVIPRATDSSNVINAVAPSTQIEPLRVAIEQLIKQAVKVEGVEQNVKPAHGNKLDLKSQPINEVLFFPDDQRVSSTSEVMQQRSQPTTTYGFVFDRFLQILSSATKSIDIAIYTITDDRISRLVESLFAEGVRVRVLTDDSTTKDEGSDIQNFADMGIPVRIDQSQHLMHHKFAVIDRCAVMNGSFNWTRSASMGNQENVVITNNATLVEQFAQQFQKLWEMGKDVPAQLVLPS